MLRRRVRSAVLIDFDNIIGRVGGGFVDHLDAWISWLEDGAFDQNGRKRRLMARRVYWNAPNEGFRKPFESRGFEAFSCPSRVEGKRSAADMVIALDAYELTFTQPQIEEYIIFTTDTDFVALVEKLTDREKTTVAFANEKDVSFTVYNDFADHVVGLSQLREDAFAYVRQPGFWEKLFARSPTVAPAGAKKGSGGDGDERPRGRRSRGGRGPARSGDELQVAIAVLETLAESSPGMEIGKNTANKALRKELGERYRTSSTGAYLGFGSYEKLLGELVKRCESVELRKKHNGGVVLVSRGRTTAAS
ncbi:MAG: NYN domain-containing protein [Pseudomonadota bacterium]